MPILFWFSALLNFTTLNQPHAQNGSLHIYIVISHRILLHVAIRKGLSSGSTTKAIPHKNKFSQFYTVNMVQKESDSYNVDIYL
jgi:hypothetical protein